jgi:hypothetical protein
MMGEGFEVIGDKDSKDKKWMCIMKGIANYNLKGLV